MLTAQSTPHGMGIRLIGEASELRHLGERVCEVATSHPNEAVGDILNSFGVTLRRSRKPPTKKSRRNRAEKPVTGRSLTIPLSGCRIAWPRFLYCLNVLQKIQAADTDNRVDQTTLSHLSQIASQELTRWEKQSHFPLAFWTSTANPFYQGDHIHGLLYIADLAWGRRKGGIDRMNYLGSVLELVSPGAWLHHDTLHFMTQLPFQYPGNGMAILREDAAYELATKRW